MINRETKIEYLLNNLQRSSKINLSRDFDNFLLFRIFKILFGS